MRLSVIMPAYNEQETILQIIDKVKAVPIEKEIIIVNDGSKDRTREKLDSIKDPHIKIIHHEKNRGKGMAIRTAIPHAIGDIIIIQDADLELDPTDYPALIEPITSGRADVVYGSRWLKNPPKVRFISKVANIVITTTANILYGSHITDEATGYKVFRSEHLKSIPLRCERFEFCPEITAKVMKRKLRVEEVPIKFNPRTTVEGKKVGWKDGFQALWTLLKYRFID